MVGWAPGEGVYKSILGVQGGESESTVCRDELRLVLFGFGKRVFEAADEQELIRTG